MAASSSAPQPAGNWDISPQERDVIQRRADLRKKLKYEYQKQILNPYRHATGEGGFVFDPALQRFMAMKATLFDHFRPNVRNAVFAMSWVILPIIGTSYLFYTTRAKKEHAMRTGQVAYKDRWFKYV